MQINEIINQTIKEASKAQARREKEERRRQELAARQAQEKAEQERRAAADQARKELARRKIAAQLRVPEPPPPVEDEPKIDPNNPLAALYAQQQEQERAQEDEIYGVDFKFQTVINKKTREKRLYGFWTRERIQRLEDVMRSGQYRDFGNFKGTNEEAISMFQLMKEIGEKYRQVYVFFDRENMQQFPGLREVLNRFKDNYKITRHNKIPFGYRLNPDNKEIEQFIAWEEVDRPPESFMFKEDVDSSSKKLVIFDIDDTLVNTNTLVNVVRDGQVVHSLNSHEFTHYKLQPGEQFDFGRFRNAQEFFDQARPIVPMVNQLNRDIKTGNKVIMVTARADFDNRDLFLSTFKRIGVDIDGVDHVYRAGNLTDRVSTEEKKRRVIDRLLRQEHYDKVIMYDDSMPNLNAFISLKQDYPWTDFYAWHVDHSGRASEYHRTSKKVVK